MVVGARLWGGEPPRLILDSMPETRFRFEGPVGERVRANLDEWLLRAPQANPGMIDMFRLRDREPKPQLVPWAGEFVGKYLLSAVQALRMTDDPRLRRQVEEVVAQLAQTQADDGYLGPFPKADRLLKNWDLWGHYHAIQALVAWHIHSGDPTALATARKAADLVCRTYLGTSRRVVEAGDPEMNMAILTGMAMLHRITGEPRYLAMAQEVEKDWEKAGDYLRAGLDGREYYRSPRPRWESLHDLQGLVELWRITGEARYRDAFIHHWRSIRRWDQRNTGGFSSGEQATGNPYAPTAIETCCTVAWMAITLDYLELTGDLRAADNLELATLNGGLGAQHPSGRWWTYNTPMDGVREASAHTIVFQARAGTPELNCCSVNGPRIPGMLSEWAIMRGEDGITLNWLGAGRFDLKLAGSATMTITSERDAWRDGTNVIHVVSNRREPIALRLRIPGYAKSPVVKLNGAKVDGVRAGEYLTLRRVWKDERLELAFIMTLEAVPGAQEAAGKVSLYRGPVLLTYDQAYNPFDENTLPTVDLKWSAPYSLVTLPAATQDWERLMRPWVVLDVPCTDGRKMRLVDFASAGARGTHYRSWLPGAPTPTPPAFTQMPPDGAKVPPGPVLFRWRGVKSKPVEYRVVFSSGEDFSSGQQSTFNCSGQRLTLDTSQILPSSQPPGKPIWWRVVTSGPHGETIAEVPPAWFVIDPAAPPQPIPPEPKLGPHGELISHSLRGEEVPKFGELKSAQFIARDAEGTEVNGRDQMLLYSLPVWPDEDWTVSVRVKIKELPRDRLGQVFSAWAASMDDPLRLVVDGGQLFARVEAGGGGGSTPGFRLETNRWYTVTAVKRESALTLHVDGRVVGSTTVPATGSTLAQDCALGGNPHYGGNEHLAARFADFQFYGRALDDPEIKALATH